MKNKKGVSAFQEDWQQRTAGRRHPLVELCSVEGNPAPFQARAGYQAAFLSALEGTLCSGESLTSKGADWLRLCSPQALKAA